MDTLNFNRHRRFISVAGAAALALSLGAKSASASGGAVQAAAATTLGYTLTTLAQDTAVYNSGVVSNNPATPAAPNIPFQMLVVNSFNYRVASSTYFYIPIFIDDNSAPVDAGFPASIANQATDASFFDSDSFINTGVSSFFVEVDGQITTLGDPYIVGVNTSPLLDGTPAGTEYICLAAVLSPLSAGNHTVSEGGYVSGVPTLFNTFNVSVPEPGGIGLLGVAGAALLRRRRRPC